MKKILIFLAFIPLMILTGCNFCDCDCDCDHNHNNNNTTNKVLMLKVDYTTNNFEGGIEYVYNQQTDSFNIDVDYDPPGDFGSIRLTYHELNETLFFGTIIWMGLGEMITPESLNPPNFFDAVLTEDIVYPSNGFLNIFPDYYTPQDYTNIWMRVQNLVKVRQFLQSNPNQQVKLFLYTPSVGMGDPLDWDWYIFIKN